MGIAEFLQRVLADDHGHSPRPLARAVRMYSSPSTSSIGRAREPRHARRDRRRPAPRDGMIEVREPSRARRWAASASCTEKR